MPQDTSTSDNLHDRGSALVLTAALLLVELIGAAQIYLASTVTPLLAAELNGQRLYGVAAAAALVASFVTMPLGGTLLARFRADHLITGLTAGSVAAAALSAAAPSMGVFILGRFLSGLASGAMATVGLGVIVSSLPGSWRRIVLASYSAVWLVGSLVGPAYAAWASHWLGWRWALVAYLPALILARLVIARQLTRVPPPPGARGPLPVRDALMLAAGIGFISALSASPVWGWAAAALGLTLIAVAVRALIPATVLKASPGQPAALSALALLAAVFFGAQAISAIAGHDILGFDELSLGLLLTAGGVGWSVTGLWCGARPRQSFATRAMVGVAAILGGLTLMCAAVFDLPALPLGVAATYIIGWTLMGTGMGLVYLDVLNRGIRGDHADLPAGEAPTVATLAEMIPTAIAMTLTTAILALDYDLAPWVFGGLAALTLGLPVLIVRSNRDC